MNNEELKKLEELLANDKKIIEENYKEIERLTKRLKEAQLGYLAVEEKNKKLHSIINELERSLKEDRILANKTGKFVLENVYLYYLDKLQELKEK